MRQAVKQNPVLHFCLLVMDVTQHKMSLAPLPHISNGMENTLVHVGEETVSMIIVKDQYAKSPLSQSQSFY